MRKLLGSKIIVTCRYCGKESTLISRSLGGCLACIRGDFGKVHSLVKEAHWEARKAFDLPPNPPKDEAGAPCHLCFNECHIPQGERSYCGLRLNQEGKLAGVSVEAARAQGLKRVRIGNIHLVGNAY